MFSLKNTEQSWYNSRFLYSAPCSNASPHPEKSLYFSHSVLHLLQLFPQLLHCLPAALEKTAHLLQVKQHNKMSILVWQQATSEPIQPVVCLGRKPWLPQEEKSDLSSSGVSCVLGAGTWEFCALWEGESWFSNCGSLGTNQHVSSYGQSGAQEWNREQTTMIV